MESRHERYKKRRKEDFIKLLKGFILLWLGTLLIFSLFKVNQTIVDLNVLDNSKMLELDLRDRALTILGETYVFNKNFSK